MVQFEGDRDFTRSPAELWAKLTDARFLVRCVPDVSTVSKAEAGEAAFVVRPGLAFIRGTLDVTLQVADAVEAKSARYVVRSKGIGSSSNVEATLTLTPTDTGTRAHWAAEVKELGGLLRLVPGGLIRGAGRKVIDGIWDAVEKQLAEGAG
jgi:carbon monoxide dehydrogenase subunit G